MIERFIECKRPGNGTGNRKKGRGGNFWKNPERVVVPVPEKPKRKKKKKKRRGK